LEAVEWVFDGGVAFTKKMEKIIFFNIAWMKAYQGGTAEDFPEGGGAFVGENEYAHEMFNFLPFNNCMYGYVQPPGKGDYFNRTINIDRLGASKQDLSADNVLAVWVAKNPAKGGTWVIGWYKNSTVYRKYQPALTNSNRILETKPNLLFGHYVTAKVEDCVCLAVKDRTIEVPRGKDGIGQSNVWYATSQEPTAVALREKVEKLILRDRTSETVDLNSVRGEFNQDFFNVISLEDARKRVLTSIVRRQGQSQFRQKLLAAYKGNCAISGCNVEQALEAAHIIPYRGTQTNVISNGLLLRADLHTLFDLKLITIDPQTMEVVVAPELMQAYGEFSQEKVKFPDSELDRPDRKAVEEHYSQCKWTKWV
jgi:HNH endonuclease